MSDLISRQEAIDALEKSKEIYFDRQVIIGVMQDIVRNLPSAQPKSYREGYQAGFKDAQPEQRWIPCSERVPFAEYGESDKVLTTCGNRVGKDTGVRWIRLLYFNGGNWCYPTGETYEQKVYAWMPLPEPYKEEQNEG